MTQSRRQEFLQAPTYCQGQVDAAEWTRPASPDEVYVP